MDTTWFAISLIGLGLFHGLNPAMGWLFAVALGMQEGNRRAVIGALAPLAIGHALSILAVVLAVELAWAYIDLDRIQFAAAALLIGLGLFRLWRGHRHRLRVGMRAGPGQLTFWSFLMATAHGAGLMLVPILLYGTMTICGVGEPGPRAGGAGMIGNSLGLALGAVALHTAAMFAATAGIALLVFEWIGLGALRSKWINIDLVWCAALVAAGAILLVSALAA